MADLQSDSSQIVKQVDMIHISNDLSRFAEEVRSREQLASHTCNYEYKK